MTVCCADGVYWGGAGSWDTLHNAPFEQFGLHADFGASTAKAIASIFIAFVFLFHMIWTNFHPWRVIGTLSY